MNRRNFLKQVAATAAVGAVAPKLLAAQPAVMGVDTAMAGASRAVVGGVQYEIALDIADWKWKWVPIGGIIHRGRSGAFEFITGEPWHPMYSEVADEQA